MLRAYRHAVRCELACRQGSHPSRKLGEFLLQRSVCLLRAAEIATLERLPQLIERLADRPQPALAASAPMVVMMMVALRSLTLKIVLNLRIVRLGGREIARLQVLRELAEFAADGIAALRRRR